LLMGDVLFLVFSLWLALFFRNLSVPSPSYFFSHIKAFILIYSVSLLIFYVGGLYEKKTRLIKSVLGARILGAQVANAVIAAVFFFILPLTITPKTILVLYLIFSVVLVSSWRLFIAPKLSFMQREKSLLIGTGTLTSDIYKEIQSNPKYYITFMEVIDTKNLVPGTLAKKIEEYVHCGVRSVVLDTTDPVVMKDIDSLYQTILTGISYVDIHSFYEELYDKVALTHVSSAWLLASLPKKNNFYSFAKRAFDIIGAGVGTVLVAPILCILAFILLCTGGKPFIYHTRIGKGGRHFNIIKLRSMLLNDHGDPELQKKNKVTQIGKVLRKSRLDELPQLLNILSGELSFIGPRPELPSIARVYEKEIPFYNVRHMVTPGLSGWAQLYQYDAPRGGADVERTRQKLSYDLYYVKHRSFGLDMSIALKTLRALSALSGT
jgi:lipopolysaccharide/colanic/teichoic acid biosynthesis glycosyltransferase